PVPSIRIDFNLRANFRRGKRRFEAGLYVGLALIVVRRDCNIQSCFDFRGEQMRAIGLVGHEKPTVERSTGAHATWQCCGGLQNIWSAQTVTVRADLTVPIHLAL